MNILFYTTRIDGGIAHIDEEESRHLTTVLRKKVGDGVDLTDGQGRWLRAEIVEVAKRHTLVKVVSEQLMPLAPARLHLAVAPTKNMDRFEWLVEKAVEIGVDTITPLLCKRSERTTVRHDRLEKVVVSAMKQCLRCYLPKLNEMTPYKSLMKTLVEPQRFIGWVPENSNMPHLTTVLKPSVDTLILIGPEGDFTEEEVQLAQAAGCLPISLGAARLRTETAGVYGCSIFNMVQVG